MKMETYVKTNKITMGILNAKNIDKYSITPVIGNSSIGLLGVYFMLIYGSIVANINIKNGINEIKIKVLI